jgi:hypothetical protein
MIFHEDLPKWLGNNAVAIAPFSSVRVKPGKVPIAPLGAVPSVTGPVLVRNAVAVLHALSDQGDTVFSVFQDFLPLVVGTLPLLVHVEMRQKVKPGLSEVPHTIRCGVLRMDARRAKVEKTVTHVFAGAACCGKGHFNGIVVAADGLSWDYDSMKNNGCLQRRMQAATVKSAPAHTFSRAVYRRSSEVQVPSATAGVAFNATTCLTPATRAVADPIASAGSVVLKRGGGGPAPKSTGSERGPALSPEDSRRNLAFMRAVTSDRGHKRTRASSYEGALSALRKDALDLAARVLCFQTLTGHPVHGPGRPTMFYHTCAGKGTGGARVAPVSPVAKDPSFCDVHERLLHFAMRGTLQEYIDQGQAEIVHAGCLIENIKSKETRCKSAINYEDVTCWTRVKGEESHRRD